MKPMTYYVITLSFVLLLLGVPSAAQQQVTTRPQAVVNGADTPELIPDREAFRSLFGMLADRLKNPPSGEFRHSILEPIGLTKDEEAAIVGAANVYGAKEASTARALQVLRAATPHKTLSEVPEARVDAIMTAQGVTLDKVIKDLQDELKPESYQRLLKFIRTTWKSKMSLYPGPKFN